MAGERNAEDIQADIERARASLAVAVDELAYRTSPRRLRDTVRRAAIEKARTPQGQAVIAGVGVVLVYLVARRIAKH